MILGFSTELNGKQTFFVDKIWSGLIHNKKSNINICRGQFDKGFIINPYKQPKLHTIRYDKNARWQAGIIIDFYINVRQKDMFQFAPRIPVISVQYVYMTYAWGKIIEISIDDMQLVSHFEREQFAINDGFDNWDDFFDYFYPKIKATQNGLYKAKLIHWTDLRY